MDCREIQARIAELAGDATPAAPLRQHLETCDECRAFQADVQEVKRLLAAPLRTPRELRAATLARCRDELSGVAAAAKSSQTEQPMSAWRRFVSAPQNIAAVALLSTAVLIAVAATIADISDDALSRFSVQSVVVQFIVQNLAAVLLAPALWPLLRRLVQRPTVTRPLAGNRLIVDWKLTGN